MATRGCIARVDGDGFRGVYHHWDSYPSELGKKLFGLARGADLRSLMRMLIDDHPAGWLLLGDECICHGKGEEEPLVVTDRQNSEWVEWAFAFDEDARTMGVLGRGEAREWRLCAVVPLDGPEPDWKQIEKGAAY